MGEAETLEDLADRPRGRDEGDSCREAETLEDLVETLEDMADSPRGRDLRRLN